MKKFFATKAQSHKEIFLASLCLLNKVSAVEECDATGAAQSFNSRAHKKYSMD
jgi:hypothetical protein